MSQATATARPLRSPGRTPRHAPAPLRVIPARITTTGNGAFASMCVVLMTTGLVALLLLNTALAHGSLERWALQRESAVLSETAGNLQEEIDRASASGALAKKASQLGLVRANERAHIDLASGKVTGTAYPATSAMALSVVTSPTPVVKPKPKPKPKPVAASPTGTPSPGASTAGAAATGADATPTKPAATTSASPTVTLGSSPTGAPTKPVGEPVSTPTAAR